MKALELELSAYGVSEMSRQEMVETDGGINPWVAFVAGAIVGGIIYDAAKTVYVAAVNAYVDASAAGTYNDIPASKR